MIASTQDIQLEQNILGAILHLNGYGEAVENAFDKLKPSDFYSVDNKKIFAEMTAMKKSGINPDTSALAVSDNMEDLYAYITELWHNTNSGLNLNYHVGMLLELSELRSIQARVNEINNIISSNVNISEKLKDIDKLFDVEIGATSNEVGARHISDCAGSYLDYLDKRWNKPQDVIFTTGIPDLDAVLGGGFEIGLNVIAARPKMGKTELMTKMINHFAIDRNLPIYVGSLEMPEDQVMHRLTSSLSRVGKDEIKRNFCTDGMYDGDAYAVFSKALSDLANTNTYIDSRHSNTVKKIRRECLKIKKKHGECKGIFVDYLGLLESDDQYSRHDLSIAAMTRALKGMSKEFECPVILLIQLNRALEKRDDKRPLPSDSRDSGAIEQDCDTWTTIYRDIVYDKDSKFGDLAEIIVRLNRHGETGNCYQRLTAHGFANVDEEVVARILHEWESEKAAKSERHTTQGF